MLVAAVVLGATAAAAQPSVTEMTIDGKTSLTEGYNRADCAVTTTMPMRVRVSVDQPSYFARFVLAPSGLPGGDCPVDMQEPELIEVFAPQQLDAISGVLELDRNVTAAELMTASACGDEGMRFTDGTLCMQLTVNEADLTALAVQGIALDFDTTTPPAVTIDEVKLGDGSATLTLGGVPDDDESYTVIIEVRACPEEDAADAGTVVDAGTTEDGTCGATGAFTEATFDEGATFEIKGLDNETRYEARVSLRDDFDNVGPVSALVVLEPAPDLGTLDLYDGAGGDLSCAPSCGTGATSSAANAGLGGLFLFGLTRRGRRFFGRHLAHSVHRTVDRSVERTGGRVASLLLLAALFASPARADFGQQTLSLAVSPYKPAIDSEIVAHEPVSQSVFPVYRCMFQGATLAEIGGDADTHLFDGFGSLQLSVGLNLAQARGKAQPTSVLDTGECGASTDTDVELSLLKLRPGLTYRADQLLDWFSVPLVPYGRVGLVAAGFAFTKSGAFETGGVDPVGMRFGWEAAAGLMIALDFLDAIDPFVPDTTRRARANGTFDHTFLFAEGAWQQLDSFGRPGLVLSPDDEFLGTRMPVMWKLGVAVELL